MVKNKNKSYITELLTHIQLNKYEHTYKHMLSNHFIINNIHSTFKKNIADIIQNINISYIEHPDININQYLNNHLNSYFISKQIKSELFKSIQSVNKINITYKSHSLCFYNFCHKHKKNNINYKQWIIMSIYAFSIAELYNVRIQNLNIYLYPSTYKKTIPSQAPISCDNINSGYTTFSLIQSDRYIVLFRKEDIENVFVHELIHYLNIDTNLLNTSDSIIKEFFNIKCNILLNEGYTETLTILYISVCNSILYNKDFKDILYNELVYSLLQSNKTFSIYNIHNSSDFNNWSDDTNTFAYIIIKTILLYNIGTFLDLFFDHRTINHEYFSKFLVNNFSHISNYSFKNIIPIKSYFLKHTFKKSIYNIIW